MLGDYKEVNKMDRRISISFGFTQDRACFPPPRWLDEGSSFGEHTSPYGLFSSGVGSLSKKDKWHGQVSRFPGLGIFPGRGVE